MVVIVYYTSITSTISLEKNQRSITDMLSAMKISFQLLDVSTDKNLLEEMRAKMGDPKAMVPQIFNGDQYCGDYEAFSQAMEFEKVKEFFKVDSCQEQSQKD
ncbi:SH3 domain-binding glutamic acid-rich-like protein 3 [Heterodontus francisci]|uniref:SH3 domain-binding glutamic acid-rich-like protein 3 n=1 Tax=Heterodontus francisci TaxID=7792 RepID=UPI00355AD0B9